MCQWMDAVIVKVAPAPPQPRPGVTAAETPAEVLLAAQIETLAESAVAGFVETASGQGAADQKLLVPLRPVRVDFDLKPLKAWFAKLQALPGLPSLHAEVLAELRATSADRLQEVSTEAFMDLKHEPFLHKVQVELLDLSEKKKKKKLLAMCTVEATPLTANSRRQEMEAKLRDATLQVIGWREGMKAYEEAAQCFNLPVLCRLTLPSKTELNSSTCWRILQAIFSCEATCGQCAFGAESIY